MQLRGWWAISCAVVLGAALALARLTRSTVTWPVVALLAAQPLPFLALTGKLLIGPVGAAVALAVAAADVVAARAVRRSVGPLARVLAGLWTAVGVLLGLGSAFGADPAESWAATGVLALAGAAALAAVRSGSRFPEVVPGGVGVVLGAALAGSLATTGDAGPLLAAGLGLALLTAGALVSRRPGLVALLVAAGAVLVLLPGARLADDARYAELALVALCGVVPATVAAVRLPRLRGQATAVALGAPYVAVLLARADDVLPSTVAGLLLALLAAAAFAVATLRTGRPEEWVCTWAGAAAGATAGAVTASAGAWGQVGLQLTVAGVAAGCYALVAGRWPVAVVAVADLVAASWIAVGGAGVGTPEAYTLPAAAGLLLIALPSLRAGARSWAAEGAAAGVALLPSAFVVVADPTALRLVLVVGAAAALAVAGTLLHRQAPFLLGTGALLGVVVGRLSPYAPLLPRWITLGAAGLLLLVVGATYERRRQQAREAVAWVAQMR
ncbi:SCO7613 C-terminal domain-containing membrane protein [Blastococcus sp. PRF04-17]|uniref:SCO7613 C-terminal domain-containing membrane protein n=1 Tax=Blastococcus sp. PRF04-17 TaxID=2933797 RepID=UPI001FF613E4|nr:hypothetical protein [Blastococcus sp. PRF04-17]UOY02129.1 hypothetical protein MVA48_01715 [Blastococcus sp. PRF04-17]